MPATHEVCPSALICFRAACFRHFLYIPSEGKGKKRRRKKKEVEEKLLLKAPAKVYSTEQASAVGRESTEQIELMFGAEHTAGLRLAAVGAEERCAACSATI